MKIQAKGIKNLSSEIKAEHFPRLRNEMDIHIEQAWKTINREYQKRNSPRYIIIKMLNRENKAKILKTTKGKVHIQK